MIFDYLLIMIYILVYIGISQVFTVNRWRCEACLRNTTYNTHVIYIYSIYLILIFEGYYYTIYNYDTKKTQIILYKCTSPPPNTSISY